MKTIVRGWVCAVGAVILSCSAAFLSGCSGLVSSANNPPPASTLVITNVQTGSVTTSSSQVVWTTNSPANSSVYYGTTTAYGTRTPVDSAMVMSHQVTLSGLAAGTTYYYQVNSTDSKGNHGNGGNTLKTAGFSITGTINPTVAGNGATVALSGTASAATTADSSGNYVFTGLPNGSYTVTPTHTGYAFTPGNQSATVNGTNVTGVNFTATPAAQQISVNPTSLNLGAIAVGSTGRGAATVSNVGGSSLTVSLISVSGGPFGVSGIITPSTILPGASATLNVTYSPSIAGNNSGAITITSNDPQTPTFTISLAGTATAAPVAPTITTQPANQTVTAGQTATFTVVAGGTAPLAYQWQKNGANIAGATAASYTTPVTVTADSGSTFGVVVSNTVGTVTSAAATLTVNAAAVAPTITMPPANQTVTAGQTATFTVVAGGTAPVNYQWQKNGASIAGANSASYATAATTTADSGSTFGVVVSNTVGMVTSATATLTVNAAAVAPTITTQPANQTVTAGQTATFTVVAGGTAPLNYQWQKNGANIAGATSVSYTTAVATTTDSGSTFGVVVSNTVGTVTSAAATLTVNAAAVAPTITMPPANQTVTTGQTATFTVVASGTAPLSYQWQKNGANIAGATTASYTTPVTVTADSGSTFAVVVSNATGTVTSIAATLTVNAAAAPAIQVSPSSINFGNAVVGSSLSQALIITNTGTATLTITQITESGATFNVSGYSLPLSVGAGQQTTITVAFLPTSAGPASGNISIFSNAPTSPTSVSLSGTGIAGTFTLGISPTNLSFGNVTTGTSSAAQSVTITNTGNSNVTISQINLSGVGYSMTGGNAPVTLSPSQTIPLVAQFSPTTAGAASGSITIVSNATGSPATISLSGTGVTPVQHSVALTWNASTSTVAGYNVYRSTVSGNSYTMINPSLVALLNYTDTTVQSGITYYYVTTAVDSTGIESVYSNEVSAAIP